MAGKVVQQQYLQRTQVAVIVLNDFWGKVLKDILLHPPQKKGQHLPMKRLHGQDTCTKFNPLQPPIHINFDRNVQNIFFRKEKAARADAPASCSREELLASRLAKMGFP